VKPSDLGHPFDSTRSEYIFKRLTKEIKEARKPKGRTGGTTPGAKTKWMDATGGKKKKEVPEDMILDLAAQVAKGHTYEPSDAQAGITFTAGTLKQVLEKKSLTHPGGSHDAGGGRKAFMLLVESFKTDGKTSRSGISRPGAFAATDLENAISLLDMPEATGGQIMTKGGEYRIVMPDQQTQYERGGWEPVQHGIAAGYMMPPEQAKNLARGAKKNPMDAHWSTMDPDFQRGLTKESAQEWADYLTRTTEWEWTISSPPTFGSETALWFVGRVTPSFTSFGEELNFMQSARRGESDMTFFDLLRAMDKWDIKNGKYILADYNETFNIEHVQSPYEWAIWAEPHLPAITRDYGLRAIWNGLIQKWQPGLIKRAREGTHTMPGSSRYKKNPPCSYRKTKRSKACGGRVSIMKNGRLYKCADCGAKYEMR
jgi:hypothetical protein